MTDAPAWVPNTGRGAIVMAVAIVLGAAIPTFFAAVYVSGVAIDDREAAQIEGCRRAKHDRIDNARAWGIAAQTWRERSHIAPTGQERQLAADTAAVYGETAVRFRSRIFLCGPLTRDHLQIPDRAAIESTRAP
jgi:hypothetical protein